MTEEPEQKRAWSAVKEAVHIYARNPSDEAGADVSAGLKALRGLEERAFWQRLKSTRTHGAKGTFKGRRYQTD